MPVDVLSKSNLRNSGYLLAHPAYLSYVAQFFSITFVLSY
jgi:hypothetical protein